MNTSQLIAQHLIDVHEGKNWSEVNIKEALEDLTLSEATTVTPASQNTIAIIVQHLTFWNHAMRQGVNGTPADIPDSNGYDDPQLTTEAD